MVTKYLFDYMLENVCHGNKSECARRLDMRRPDLNRLAQRIHDGSASARAIESILVLMKKENLSIDDVMEGYCDENGVSHAKPESPTKLLRDNLMTEWKNANMRMDVFKGAESFMYELETTFCCPECRATHDCEHDCPCKRFYEYMSWLKGEMDKSA